VNFALALRVEFARFWQSHDVAGHGEGYKRINHPQMGPLDLEFPWRCTNLPLSSPPARILTPEANREFCAGSPSSPGLSQQSVEFARFWQSHDVAGHGEGYKRINHPQMGPLSLESNALALYEFTPQLSPGEDPDA
jgi:hypothetical protein